MAALMLAASASAATIADLTALGYTVTISNPGPAGKNCPTYYVTGHGVSTYVNCDTPQSDIDSFANPATICNADWQINHPDQLAAFQTIVAKGYSVSGDQCADTYTVRANGRTYYSGSGSGLPSLAPQLTSATTATAGPTTPSDTGSTGGGSCLPLCSSPSPTEADAGNNAGTNSPAAADPAVVHAPVQGSTSITFVYDPATGAVTDTRSLMVGAGDAVAV